MKISIQSHFHNVIKYVKHKTNNKICNKLSKDNFRWKKGMIYLMYIQIKEMYYFLINDLK